MALKMGTQLISKWFGTDCFVCNINFDYYGPNVHGYQIVASNPKEEKDYHPGWMPEEQVLKYYEFKDTTKQVLYGR